MNSLLLTDGYKTSHNKQYPDGTTLVFSNFTPRGDKHAPLVCRDKGIIVFGVQMVFQQIHEHFEKNFFLTKEREQYEKSHYESLFHKELANRELEKLMASVIEPIKFELDMYLNTDYDVTHFEELWKLGYLPIEVRALEEGTICPIRVPMMTIHNTNEDFFWITNYLETIISNLLWKPITSATIARAYKKIINEWAIATTGVIEGTEWQGHDFSMRGMDSIDATIASGLGHLTSFSGTDSLPTLYGARHYYNEKNFVAGSVVATEHSVMCAGSKEDEKETYERLMRIYPTGILSVVSDTWDLWNVITVILPQLKEQILGRDGKLVIRPDSGDPVDIICGTDNNGSMLPSQWNSNERKGVIELLWDIFGGTVNEQGYKVLDSHIGAIYGDSITTERCNEICKRLEAKGFASSNIVFGIGSFTYQFNTRDTFGFAMKATYIEKEENFYASPESVEPGMKTVGYEIFKDPITDDGLKKSAKGLLKVVQGENELELVDQISWEEFNEDDNLLQVVYENGEFPNRTTLTTIREKLNSYGKN